MNVIAVIDMPNEDKAAAAPAGVTVINPPWPEGGAMPAYRPTLLYLLPLLLVGAWRPPTHRGTVLHPPAARPGLPLRTSAARVPPAVCTSIGVHHEGSHRDQHSRGTSATDSMLSTVMRPLLRLATAAWRLVTGALRYLRGIGAAATSRVEVVPSDTVPLEGARSIDNLVLVQGEATRSFPPPDELLLYFNYGLSPFYAELPQSEAPAVVAPTEAGSSVRWLRHRYTRVSNEFQRAADEGRLSLLRELYADAEAQERSARGSPRWLNPFTQRDD